MTELPVDVLRSMIRKVHEGGRYVRRLRRFEFKLEKYRKAIKDRRIVVAFTGTSAMSEHRVPSDVLAMIFAMTDWGTIRICR